MCNISLDTWPKSVPNKTLAGVMCFSLPHHRFTEKERKKKKTKRKSNISIKVSKIVDL